jgi:hypothetical protein
MYRCRYYYCNMDRRHIWIPEKCRLMAKKGTDLLTYRSSIPAISSAVIASGAHAPYTLHPQPLINCLWMASWHPSDVRHRGFTGVLHALHTPPSRSVTI